MPSPRKALRPSNSRLAVHRLCRRLQVRTTRHLRASEAEPPAPDRPIPTLVKGRRQLKQLKLSQQLGLCILVVEDLGQRGNPLAEFNLGLLQRRCTLECIESALAWRERCLREPKLLQDFLPSMEVLSTTVVLHDRSSRATSRRRIGLGPRDRGTAPSAKERGARARAKAMSEDCIWLEDVGPEALTAAQEEVGLLPRTVDGWLPLGEVRDLVDPPSS